MVLTSAEHMEEDDEQTKALPEWVRLEWVRESLPGDGSVDSC